MKYRKYYFIDFWLFHWKYSTFYHFLLYSIWSRSYISSKIKSWYVLDIKNLCLCKAFRDCFLLHKLMGVSAKYLIVDTSKRGCRMVHVAMLTLSLVMGFSQYQFLLSFVILRYSAFTISSPVFMTCLSTFLSYCIVYGYDYNLTT